MATSESVQRRRANRAAKRPKLTGGQWETLLADQDACRQLDRTHGPGYASERRRVLGRDRKNLGRIVPLCPDSPWFFLVWIDGAQFPPGADLTGMVVCNCCHRYYPPQYLTSSGACQECAHDAMTPMELHNLVSSPGVIDMARLKAAARAGKPYP